MFRFEGQCSVFGLDDGPCYRCFFQEPPAPGEIASCAEAGVIGVLPGIIGLLQANEAIKVICRIGQPLKGRILLFDALTTRFREIEMNKDPECPVCGSRRTIHTPVEYAPICDIPPQIPPPSSPKENIQEITVQELKRIMDTQPLDLCLVDVRETEEWEIARIEGAILKPLSILGNNYQDIPRDKKVIVYCKMGGRSAHAVQFLREKGYDNVMNLQGGIQAWAEKIDQ